jgi:hypothetical protein
MAARSANESFGHGLDLPHKWLCVATTMRAALMTKRRWGAAALMKIALQMDIGKEGSHGGTSIQIGRAQSHTDPGL